MQASVLGFCSSGYDFAIPSSLPRLRCETCKLLWGSSVATPLADSYHRVTACRHTEKEPSICSVLHIFCLSYCILKLLYNLRYNSGTHCSSAFSDSKSYSFFDSDWSYQRYYKFSIISRHTARSESVFVNEGRRCSCVESGR